MIPAQKGCKWDYRPPLEIHFRGPIMLLFIRWIEINIFLFNIIPAYIFVQKCPGPGWYAWILLVQSQIPSSNSEWVLQELELGKTFPLCLILVQ